MIPRDAIDDSPAKAVRFAIPGVKENAVRAIMVVEIIVMLAISNALEKEENFMGFRIIMTKAAR